MNFNQLINFSSLEKEAKKFKLKKPFNYCIVDNFFKLSFAKKLESEIPNYSQDIWHGYNNAIEYKKLTNNWNHFNENTYSTFAYLVSEHFSRKLENILKIKKIINDPGLHGGGMHIHKNGGKLNPHLDYYIHPKKNEIRKVNLIIYLSSNWKEKNGGHLGFWKKNKEKLNLYKEILPKFNRAVFFDTSQDSWHGLSQEVKCEKNMYRKSFAIYYLIKNNQNKIIRKKALFETTESQKNNQEVKDLIKIRSNEKLWEIEKKRINKRK